MNKWYRCTSLSTDFLSANLLFHFCKIGQICQISKWFFLSVNSVFAVQITRTYLPRITRPTWFVNWFQTRFTASNNFTISYSFLGKLISFKACLIFNLMLTLALLHIWPQLINGISLSTYKIKERWHEANSIAAGLTRDLIEMRKMRIYWSIQTWKEIK